MKFERESWRKLYVVESAEHRMLSVFARGLRDYLLRLASDDGTLLSSTKDPKKDLTRLLNPEAQERVLLPQAYDDLMRIGYLSFEGTRLWITRFTDAQAARSPGAKRQADYKKRHPRPSPETSPTSSPDTSPNASPEASSVTSPGDDPVTSQRDETRRDETTTTKPPVVVTLADRSRAVLENPHDGQYSRPSQWPETLAVCEAWSFGMALKLRDFVDSDSDLKAILQAFSDGYSVAELVEAGRRAATSSYFAKQDRPGPASFTAAVLRRLLAERTAASGSGEAINLDDMGIAVGAEGLS